MVVGKVAREGGPAQRGHGCGFGGIDRIGGMTLWSIREEGSEPMEVSTHWRVDCLYMSKLNVWGRVANG